MSRLKAYWENLQVEIWENYSENLLMSSLKEFWESLEISKLNNYWETLEIILRQFGDKNLPKHLADYKIQILLGQPKDQ